MKPIFVDTSGWYDLVVPGTAGHASIMAVVRSGNFRLVTSTYILDELISLMVKRKGHAAAERAGRSIRSPKEARLEHPEAAEEAQAWRLFLNRPDKSYSLTDCLSFMIMRRLGITEVIATDHHFRQEGFTVLP